MLISRRVKCSKRIVPYIILTFFMTVISIRNEDIVRVVEVPGLLIIMIFLYSAKLDAYELKKGLIKFLKITSVVFALPLSNNQIDWTPSYCGIFSNPNKLGELESLAFCLLFVHSCEYYLSGKKIPKSNLIVMALSVFCCLVSQSRISLIGIVLTVFGLTTYATFYMKRNKVKSSEKKIRRLKRITVVMVLGVICAIGLLYFRGKLLVLYTKMTNFYTVESRFDLYKTHLSAMDLFGTNRKYVTIGTDNTFIYLTVWFGPIVAVLFYILVSGSFFYLIRVHMKKALGYDGFYAVISMGIFLVQSITTDMLFTAAMFFTIIFYGLVFSKNNAIRGNIGVKSHNSISDYIGDNELGHILY